MVRALVLALLLGFTFPTLSHGWGARGHRAVAEIAFDQLTARTREKVEALLGAGREPFVAAATWADSYSNSARETAYWHLIDRPLEAEAYDPGEHCEDGDCLVAKIDEFARAMADDRLPRAERIMALQWVIHFVGEIHQPLHVVHDDDDWGDEVWVRIGSDTERLHIWWDSRLVHGLGRTPSEIAGRAMTGVATAELNAWRSGGAREWAEESYRIARDFIYARSRGRNDPSNPIVLPPSYLDEATPQVARALARAGTRLAWLVNRAFDPASE